jgi:hypothetical protein
MQDFYTTGKAPHELEASILGVGRRVCRGTHVGRSGQDRRRVRPQAQPRARDNSLEGAQPPVAALITGPPNNSLSGSANPVPGLTPHASRWCSPFIERRSGVVRKERGQEHKEQER